MYVHMFYLYCSIYFSDNQSISRPVINQPIITKYCVYFTLFVCVFFPFYFEVNIPVLFSEHASLHNCDYVSVYVRQ